jgi:hypothetical protein
MSTTHKFKINSNGKYYTFVFDDRKSMKNMLSWIGKDYVYVYAYPDNVDLIMNIIRYMVILNDTLYIHTTGRYNYYTDEDIDTVMAKWEEYKQFFHSTLGY